MDSTANLRLAGLTAPQARELRAVAGNGRTSGVVGSGRVVTRLVEAGLLEHPTRGYFDVVLTEAGREALRVLDGGEAYVEERGRRALARAAAERWADGTTLRQMGLADGRPATDEELRTAAKVARGRGNAEHGANRSHRAYRRAQAAWAEADAIEAILAERTAATAVELEPATEAHPDDDAAELAAPAAGGRRYTRGAVHYFPADDPGVALCGASVRGSIDTEAPVTCATCGRGVLERGQSAGYARTLEARRQAEAPAPTLPGVDAAIVEASLGGPAEPVGEELTLVVVPCSGAKLDVSAPAGELYLGTLHTAARAAADAVVERAGGRVAILSALYGLLELDTVVDPYDLTVGDPGAIDAVGLALQIAATGARRVVALTPTRYTELLRSACRAAGVELVAPLSGCRGIGEQRGRLRRLRTGELDLERAA